ncbi:MAG: TSCPD domain-containing protein, partial [Bacteroidales bacterium]|nr:TSCPD domain-containing protein [Bacteroidales bacterium]
RLVKGQKADEVIKKLKGIRCGDKPTSCPDQLCRALEQLQHSKE